MEPDPIHTYGGLPYRDVLTYEEMKAYPVLVLCYIDVESTQSLARYVLQGGFVLARTRYQLDLLEGELRKRLEGRMQPSAPRPKKPPQQQVHRVDIWADHSVMEAYYSVRGYASFNPRRKDRAPLQGLEVDGRLVAIFRTEGGGSCARFCNFNCDAHLFANAVMYGLVQSSPP